MTMIILTAMQADEIRGPTSPGHALDPRPLADGTFALPVTVLEDPHHVHQHEFLTGIANQSGLVREVSEEEWAVEIEEK